LIGHVQLSVEDPTRALQHPGPPADDRPLSCNAMVSMGLNCDKKQARSRGKTGTESPIRCLRASLHPLCSPD
jgi:hypothetical protein